MNILNFLNSISVKKYLIDIGYSINSAEAIWIVHHNINYSIHDKLKAYDWIYYNMKEIKFPKSQFLKFSGTTHDFISTYKNIVCKYINDYEMTDDIPCTDEEYYIINEIFEEMFFNIPHPFKNGDIVTVNHGCLNFHKTEPKPYILEIYQGDIDLIKSRINDDKFHLDEADMMACIYTIGEDGIIHRDHGPNYIDLEYCDNTNNNVINLSKLIKKSNETELFKINSYIDNGSLTTEEITDWVNNGCKLK